MPIEIREIIIRATIQEGAGTGTNTPVPAAPDSNAAQETVEQVLQILQDKNER